MRRTGRVIFIFVLIVGCMLGLWLFQSWREEQVRKTERTLHNVYITEVSGSSIQTVSNQGEQTYETVTAVTGQAVNGVADLILQQDKVVRIVKKPEVITEKLLRRTDSTVTLEEYGEVALDENFVLYKIDKNGTVGVGETSDLVIGDTDIQFVAAGEKICAAILQESVLEKIRVLLYNSDYSSYDMEKVTVTSNQNYQITCDKEKTYHAKGEEVTFTAAELKERTEVSAENGGTISIVNIKRKQGTPAYRGTIEIDRWGESLHVINELPLEEYLYSVVPSEMPTEYEESALKAQAICARTYAVQQMQGQRLAEQGAHVDDSVSFQVYNDLKEDEKSIAAVNSTKGQVVTYDGDVASTYFYSTSCGSSAGTKEVWYTKADKKYLPSALLNDSREEKNLSGEEDFQAFIKEPPETTDSSEAWYRWQTTISAESMKKSIEKNIAARYKVNSTQIQVKEEDGTFKSREVTSVGEIKNIEVKERGPSGIVSMLEIEGTEETVRIYTEYNIRTLLAGENTKFTRQDKKEVTGLSILPSGFFYIEKKGDSFTIQGGGYGHGVGMSQTGANELAKKGKSVEDILTFYFPETIVQSLEVL